MSSSLNVFSLNMVNLHPYLWNEKKVPTLQLAQDFPLQKFTIPKVGDLRGLSVVPDFSVWVSGTNGSVACTDNSGESWTVSSICDVPGLDFRAIHGFNAQEACAMSVGLSQDKLARIYRTSDQGNSWKLVFQTDTPNVFLNAMKFWDDKNGIVLGDPIQNEFVLFTTSDGGYTWKRLIPSSMPLALPNEAVFAASNSCLAVQEDRLVWFATGRGPVARVFFSSDRGHHWNVADTPLFTRSETSGIFSLAFRNCKEGIAVGGDYKSSHFPEANVLITEDGGLHWQPHKNKHLAGLYLSSVAWISETNAVAIEGNSKIFNSVSSVNGSIWAVGAQGACARYLTKQTQ
jgi:photosystem II stability/assembly factor-like uncharacterized protein